MKKIFQQLADFSVGLHKPNYVPFISEVEEFNTLMGKEWQNRTTPTINPDDAKFVVDFIQEELDELKESIADKFSRQKRQAGDLVRIEGD